MKRLFTTVAVSALVLGAGASAWAQSAQAQSLGTIITYSDGHGAWPTDHEANALNRGIADRNSAASAENGAAMENYQAAMSKYDAEMTQYYGSSGVQPPASVTTTTTTTTTYPGGSH